MLFYIKNKLQFHLKINQINQEVNYKPSYVFHFMRTNLKLTANLKVNF